VAIGVAKHKGSSGQSDKPVNSDKPVTSVK
jgi:hypothetical protein